MRALDFLIDWVVEQERGVQEKIARGILEDLEFVDYRDFMLEGLDRLTNAQLKEMRDYLDEKIENNEAETSMCDDCLHDLTGACDGDVKPCKDRQTPDDTTFKIGDVVRIKSDKDLRDLGHHNVKGSFAGVVDNMLKLAGTLQVISEQTDNGRYILSEIAYHWNAEMLEKVDNSQFIEWLLISVMGED